ncbi:hypothetical protein PFISCL1PPCAC_5381, partial [Pristionchus fissidentatus]
STVPKIWRWLPKESDPEVRAKLLSFCGLLISHPGHWIDGGGRSQFVEVLNQEISGSEREEAWKMMYE